MRHLPFLLIPTVALVAQAPAPVDLAQRFNSELSGVNQLLKELKFPEALAKTQSLIPAERPRFDISSPKAMGQCLDNAQGLMSLYRLYANAASQNGQWEKAVEIQEERAKTAKAFLADLDKIQAPVKAQWEKANSDSQAFIAKNQARQQELQKALKELKEEVDAVNAKKKTLDAKGLEALKARIAKAPQDQQELDQINAALPVHQQNVRAFPGIKKTLEGNHKEADGMVKAAEEAVVKAKKNIADQNDEITQFNTQQMLKKVKIQGRKTWVDAVLRDHENVTKQGSPQEQASFLNRLLVLDPGNPSAQKALDNLKAGKDAFAKEAKPTTKAKSRKK